MATGCVHHPVRDVRQVEYEYQRWEDSRNDLPPVPGGRNTVGCGVRAADDGRRAFIPGETACMGTVHVVRGGHDNRVSGILSTDAAWEGNGQEVVLGNQVPRQRDMHL